MSAAPAAAALQGEARAHSDAIPDDIFQEMLTDHGLIGSPGLAWKRRVVTVAFNGGSDELYALIEQTAREWTAQGGQLTLSFRNSSNQFRQWTYDDVRPAANIRIAFADGPRGGYWSAVGVLAGNVRAGLPTMNLEGFPTRVADYFNGENHEQWLQTYEHSTILHEFGHALGLSHEHFNPQCQSDLKLERAVEILMGLPNEWTREQALFNMDSAYYFRALAERAGPLDVRPVTSPATDQLSVMLYSFNDDDVYDSGANSPCRPAVPLGYATTLSSGDRRFFMSNYRRIATP